MAGIYHITTKIEQCSCGYKPKFSYVDKYVSSEADIIKTIRNLYGSDSVVTKITHSDDLIGKYFVALHSFYPNIMRKYMGCVMYAHKEDNGDICHHRIHLIYQDFIGDNWNGKK